ncbi:hypothetical protein NYR95_19890 [Xanthomonas dyei]|uniref:Acyl carrier protein n=1 Tax=Xanthomonas dyei TaxID=743699 RepID=A0ABZ0DDW5_9XANT|nr:hypothetical protein [Xanthomonas dyei]WOB25910.1 hypothetical protein NYR99_19885 [Xanthomonas dyei]WOB53533.1 hypothetical protein NYR95_19890 [Xanthomonas dyei]
MVDPDTFDDSQKQLLSLIVDDLNGPTSVGALLRIMENVIYSLKPDFDLDNFSNEPGIKSDIEICMAALSYMKVKQITSEN